MASAQFSRILLKLSGESLMGSRPYGVDPDVTRAIANQIAANEVMPPVQTATGITRTVTDNDDRRCALS